MDALSHILEDIHLRGAEYLYVSGHDRWCFGLTEQTIFHVVLMGSVRLVLPNVEERILEAGDIAFIPAGAEHRFLHPEAVWKNHSLLPEFNGHRIDPVHLGDGLSNSLILSVRCLLDVEMARPLLSSLPPSIVIQQGLDGSGPVWLRLGLDFLALESELYRPGRDTLINRLVSMFLIECVRDYVEQLPKNANNWLNAVRDPYLSPVLSAIHAKPAYGWTVVELAGIACLSRSAFAERFSQIVGQPPLAYLTQYRLRLATRLLIQQDLSISRVSEKVGYASETAFSQAFRRQYDVSPSQYKKERAV
jgi:AraC-like DNA-binding protein